MKRLSTAVLLLVPQLVFAQQQLSKVSIERGSVVPNEAVRVNVESSDGRVTNCGLLVVFGDGDSREVRIGIDTLPITHQFEYPGRYGIRVEPKTVVRGIGTAFPCTGDPQTVKVTVLDPNEDRNNSAGNLAARAKVLDQKEATLRELEAKLNARDLAAAADKPRSPVNRGTPKASAPADSTDQRPAPTPVTKPPKPKPADVF